jgi:hypothetical protein
VRAQGSPDMLEIWNAKPRSKPRRVSFLHRRGADLQRPPSVQPRTHWNAAKPTPSVVAKAAKAFDPPSARTAAQRGRVPVGSRQGTRRRRRQPTPSPVATLVRASIRPPP